jgi:NAD/NADP transhydrogenase alpha subunit
MIQLISVTVRASRVGLIRAGVAVTSAVNISLGAVITDRDLNHPAYTLCDQVT